LPTTLGGVAKGFSTARFFYEVDHSRKEKRPLSAALSVGGRARQAPMKLTLLLRSDTQPDKTARVAGYGR
jgi:hypothetical protein